MKGLNNIHNNRGAFVTAMVTLTLVMSLSVHVGAQSCVGQPITKSLTISNTGTEDDTYSISASNPEWVRVDDKVFVGAGQTVNLDIIVTPQQVGTSGYQITIAGTKGPAQKVTGTVTVMECRGVTVITSPSEQMACERVDAEFDVIIKNRGQITDTFDISSSMGSLEKSKVELESQQSISLKLTVDTNDMEDETEIFVSAASGDVSDSDSVVLRIKNCYSAQLAISPHELSLCPSDIVNYQIYLKNTGEIEDDYLLTIMDEVTQTVELDSEESRFFNLSLPLEEGEGSIEVLVTAVSEHISLQDSATLVIKPVDECYSVEPETDIINIEQCTAKSVPIKLKNNGDESQTFRLTVDGPEWVYLNDDIARVDSGQESEVYLYISPLYETETDTYNVRVNAESDRSESEMLLTINVMPDASDYEPPSQPEKPEPPTGEDGNVTLNVSIGDETTGAISLGAAPLWKTVVVAFITLIIVIILVVRFAILVKQ